MLVLGRNELEKICSRCKKVKPLSMFYNNLTKKDGRNGICSDCQLEVNKENRK